MAAGLTPIVNDLSRPFWTAAAEGRFVLPHCVATDRPFWPPSPASPFRTAGAVDWRAAEAAGTLLSLVVYRRAFQRELASALPYGIGLVEVAPDVRLHAHVARPDDVLAAGARVLLGFRPLVAQGMPVLSVMQVGATSG